MKCDPKALKCFFFKKIPKNRPATGGFISRSQSVIRLSKLVYLHKAPNLDIFICNFCFKSSPFTKLSVKCQTRPRLLIFHSMTPLSHKKFLFRKILMTSLHVIFGLGPPQSKILATPMHGEWHFEPCPPKSLLVLPKAFVVEQLANFCPKTDHHKRFFQLNSKTDQVNVIK